ncbi:MAG: hypothetical protein EZS28_054665, partial [Streblomastix strix]
MLPSNV